MASSSLSQEDFEADYETSARRTRVRTARARNINVSSTMRPVEFADNEDGQVGVGTMGSGSNPVGLDGNVAGEHDASPKPTASRTKDKRVRANHVNKGKQQRDRRKLREKRRSTGVVHLPSTESTGGSTGEDEAELLSLSAETKKNTLYNELIDRENNVYHPQSEEEDLPKSFTSRRNKSPSDLEADDEDNQDYDSTINQSNSNASLAQETGGSIWLRNTNGRPETPSSENLEEELQNVDVEYEKVKEENQSLVKEIAQLAVK